MGPGFGPAPACGFGGGAGAQVGVIVRPGLGHRSGVRGKVTCLRFPSIDAHRVGRRARSGRSLTTCRDHIEARRTGARWKGLVACEAMRAGLGEGEGTGRIRGVSVGSRGVPGVALLTPPRAHATVSQSARHRRPAPVLAPDGRSAASRPDRRSLQLSSTSDRPVKDGPPARGGRRRGSGLVPRPPEQSHGAGK